MKINVPLNQEGIVITYKNYVLKSIGKIILYLSESGGTYKNIVLESTVDKYVNDKFIETINIEPTGKFINNSDNYARDLSISYNPDGNLILPEGYLVSFNYDALPSDITYRYVDIEFKNVTETLVINIPQSHGALPPEIKNYYCDLDCIFGESFTIDKYNETVHNPSKEKISNNSRIYLITINGNTGTTQLIGTTSTINNFIDNNNVSLFLNENSILLNDPDSYVTTFSRNNSIILTKLKEFPLGTNSDAIIFTLKFDCYYTQDFLGDKIDYTITFLIRRKV